MKPIPITCVVCGTFAFMFPMLYQLATNMLVAYALANTHFSTITLEPLEVIYRLGSVCFGLSLTTVGIFSGIFNRPAAMSGDEHKDNALPLAQPGNA